jgi:hypothetical protein
VLRGGIGGLLHTDTVTLAGGMSPFHMKSQSSVTSSYAPEFASWPLYALMEVISGGCIQGIRWHTWQYVGLWLRTNGRCKSNSMTVAGSTDTWHHANFEEGTITT